jgi:hypothetical protein
MKARKTHDTAAGTLPSGYQRAEVGVIPDDWEARSVGSMGMRSSIATIRRFAAAFVSRYSRIA